MTKIKNILSVEKIDFKKILFLSLLTLVFLSPFRIAKAGVLQDITNGLKDGFTAETCTIGAGEGYCVSDLTYFPRGNYDRNFTVSSDLEEKIEMEKKKILFGAVTYYKGKGKVEYKTTRFDLKDSKGEIVAQIHGYAIPTAGFLLSNLFDGNSSSETGSLKVKDCQIQNGSNSCPAQIVFEFPKNYDKSITVKSEFGDVVKMEKNGVIRNLFTKEYAGYGPAKNPTTNFIVYDNEGKIMNTGTAKATCKDSEATVVDGYCVKGEIGSGTVSGDSKLVTFYAEPNPCLIEEGGKSCKIKFTWDLTNASIDQDKSFWDLLTSKEKVQIFTTNKEGVKEIVYDGTFKTKDPRGQADIPVPYQGGVYQIGYKYKKQEVTFSSLTVLAKCTDGTKWNDSYCVSYVTTGKIEPEFSSCEIAEGQSGCVVSLSWKTDDPNPEHTSEIKIDTKLVDKSNVGSKDVTVSYPETVFTLEHKNKILDKSYANSYCAEGTLWDGSKCLKSTCPEPPSPPDDPEGKMWKNPVCDYECKPSDCEKYNSSKEVSCATQDGVEFKYNCCQLAN